MAKHVIPTERITGEFKYLYASSVGAEHPTKRLYFTINITERGEYITYDVEINDKIYPFTGQLDAIEYYNRF